MTRRAFVVGHPIAHSRSPLIHGHWLAELGIDGTYERIDVAPADFPDFVRSLAAKGFAGGNVTIPHKEAAFALCDTRTERADKIGAVNTLIVDADGRIRGDNTDAEGFVRHVEQSVGAERLDAVDRALVLGAGGAARAIVVGLRERGIPCVLVANRTLERAQSLAAIEKGIEAIAWDDLPKALAATRLLVNTTSLGMTGHPPLALDLSTLPPDAIVSDIVYAPLDTDLLLAGRARGLATVDGLGMLLHQAVPGFAAWFGVRPTVTAALRETIMADLTATRR